MEYKILFFFLFCYCSLSAHVTHSHDDSGDNEMLRIVKQAYLGLYSNSHFGAFEEEFKIAHPEVAFSYLKLLSGFLDGNMAPFGYKPSIYGCVTDEVYAQITFSSASEGMVTFQLHDDGYLTMINLEIRGKPDPWGFGIIINFSYEGGHNVLQMVLDSLENQPTNGPAEDKWSHRSPVN
jgi:hypothetical protein